MVLLNVSVEDAAKELGHIASYEEAGYMSDKYLCSCGWESKSYFDGAEYAWDEWSEHAKEIIKLGQARIDF